MPKKDIDYSNTIIYKIFCKNSDVKDIYVGHTTNFIQRKYMHKNACENDSINDINLYDVINNNGGWNNWEMEIIIVVNCKDQYEAKQKEKEYIILLNANLNSRVAKSKQQNTKNVTNMVALADEATKTTNLVQKSTEIIRCEFCDYSTSRESHYMRHLSTAKHEKTTIRLQKVHKKYKCNICNKVYNHHSSLWKHNTTCKIENYEALSDKEIIMKLLKDNQEFKNLIISQNETIKDLTNKITTIDYTSNSHNNSNNKTFNLNFFLNETCKNAMNITDFVQNIQLQISDLEDTGRLGYVQGVSKIIMNNLKNMSYHDRPMHCSDIKREILYIKDNNEWIKETNDRPILTKAIKMITNENIKQINEFKKIYPDCRDYDSKKNDLYLKIVSNSISGSTKEETDKNINKIIKNLLKEVIIDK